MRAQRRRSDAAATRPETTELPGLAGDAESLLALQRLAGNTAVARLVAGGLRAPMALYRQRTAARERAMTLADFRQSVGRFGVTRVEAGTLDDQVEQLNHEGGSPPLGDILRRDIAEHNFPWQQWGPGDASSTYSAVFAGLEDFERGMGGVPPVSEIWFYDHGIRRVRVGGADRAAWDQAAAEFGGGKLFVYRATEQQASQKVLPLSRDRPGHSSRTEQGSQALGIRHIVTHELGHGAGEQAARARPDLFEQYRTRVGWVGAGQGERLYDIGAPEAQAALDRGEAPEDRFHITPESWNQGWAEQPVSRYMATQSGEDFAEAVMAYVEKPQVLRSRSPRRFAFVEEVSRELFGEEREEATPAAGR